MKTIIMAGGRGTRISERFPDIPKPLIPIDGVPVLEREICSLRDQGFTDLILTISHMGDKIRDHFGDGSRLGVHITYFNEETPLGNAGALFLLRDKLDEDFLMLTADAVFDVDFNRMVDFHRAHGGLVTLFTHPNSHPFDSSLLVADEAGSVVRWLTKEDVRPEFYRNRVNAGLHILSPKVLDMAAAGEGPYGAAAAGSAGADNVGAGAAGAVGADTGAQRGGIDVAMIGKAGDDGKIVKVDLDRKLLKPLSGTGQMFCYDSPEYVKDMGTPERYDAVCRDFKAGTVQAKNLKEPQKAVFLDRDGTINKYVGFLRKIDQFELLPGVAEAIRKINASGYLCIVATNQPVIARGEVTVPELEEIHMKMETLLGLEGAYLDGLYYCPHHPHKGYAGEVPELKIECSCRKPKPGMLLKAAEDFNIDLGKSWMVGDGENDILAGRNAGCRTALICGAEETGAENTGTAAGVGVATEDGAGAAAGAEKTGAEETGAENIPDFGQDMTVRSLSEFAERVLN